jgi:hypothetical protein
MYLKYREVIDISMRRLPGTEENSVDSGEGRAKLPRPKGLRKGREVQAAYQIG